MSIVERTGTHNSGILHFPSFILQTNLLLSLDNNKPSWSLRISEGATNIASADLLDYLFKSKIYDERLIQYCQHGIFISCPAEL